MNIKTYSNKTTHSYLFILGIYYLEIVQRSACGDRLID